MPAHKTCSLSTALFPHQSDHDQFKTIFHAIDDSPLTKSMHICHFMMKEIAEFATGNFKQCFNSKCTNTIPTLFQDAEIYNNDHNNAHKIGYKYDKHSNQYFCSECMNEAEPCHPCDCDCNALNFMPDLKHCPKCSTFICNCPCKCECNYFGKCSNCKYSGCVRCADILYCLKCVEDFCPNCRIPNDHFEFCVCIGCYDDTIIKCDFCPLQFALEYEGNTELWATNYDPNKHGPRCYNMTKCINEACDTWICHWCCFKQGAQRIKCGGKKCTTWAGFVCWDHVDDNNDSNSINNCPPNNNKNYKKMNKMSGTKRTLGELISNDHNDNDQSLQLQRPSAPKKIKYTQTKE